MESTLTTSELSGKFLWPSPVFFPPSKIKIVWPAAVVAAALLLYQRGVDIGISVIGDICLLSEVVVESRSPLSAAEASRRGAVVNHVGNSARVHVGVERVDCFYYGLIADLGEGMPFGYQNIDLRHHRRNVDSGREGVDGDFAFDPARADAFSDSPHFCAGLGVVVTHT